jgi:acyl-coenzyme A synthetase/AMP-(fatty) acid ligase
VHAPTQLSLNRSVFEILNLQYYAYTQGDVFGCVADVGWVTGHTYAVYGPLLLGIYTYIQPCKHIYVYTPK